MYDELELERGPTRMLCRTRKQCQSGGPASRGEQNRLNWFNLIKQQTALSVKLNLFLLLCMWFYMVSVQFNNTKTKNTFQFQTICGEFLFIQ